MTVIRETYEQTMARVKLTREREAPLIEKSVKAIRLAKEIASRHEAQLRAMNEANGGVAIMRLTEDAPITGIQLFEEFKLAAVKQDLWFEELPEYMMRLTIEGHRHERVVLVHVMTRGNGINIQKFDYD